MYSKQPEYTGECLVNYKQFNFVIETCCHAENWELRLVCCNDPRVELICSQLNLVWVRSIFWLSVYLSRATGIAEVMRSNPPWSLWNFFMGFLCNCFSCFIAGDDLFHTIKNTMLITRPRPKARSRLVSLFVLVGVANRHWLVASGQSRDADWFARAVFRSRNLATSFSVKKHEIMVLACQVGPFHLTLTQINSERNYIAKNKCPESQKLDTRRRNRDITACHEEH